MADRIPDISDEKLALLMKRIKPLVRFEVKNWLIGNHRPVRPSMSSEGLLFHIKPVDPRRVAFLWDPKPAGPAVLWLRCFDTIRTYHTWGAPSLFKPSIAEVLAQLTEEQASRAVGFEVMAGDLDSRNVLSDGYHTALTRLYEPDPKRP